MTQTLFPSPMYQNYGKMAIAKNQALGQSGIPLEDVGLFQEQAQEVGLPVPLAERLLEPLQTQSG